MQVKIVRTKLLGHETHFGIIELYFRFNHTKMQGYIEYIHSNNV